MNGQGVSVASAQPEWWQVRYTGSLGSGTARSGFKLKVPARTNICVAKKERTQRQSISVAPPWIEVGVWCHPRAGDSPHHQPRPLLQARSPHGSPAGGAWAPPPLRRWGGTSSAGAATDAKRESSSVHGGMQRCWSQRGAAATRAVGEEPLARVGRLAALRRHENAPREGGGGRLEVLLWRHGP